MKAYILAGCAAGLIIWSAIMTLRDRQPTPPRSLEWRLDNPARLAMLGICGQSDPLCANAAEANTRAASEPIRGAGAAAPQREPNHGRRMLQVTTGRGLGIVVTGDRPAATASAIPVPIGNYIASS
jgi:hypothetical protein